MYGLTRGMLTLIGVAGAGILCWLAVYMREGERGEYWAAAGLFAAAGLAMALSQLLGGWTKWGWPQVSPEVLVLGFVPALVLGGWVVGAHEPAGWFADNHGDWSRDLGIGGIVGNLGEAVPALAFGIGLVFGLTLDTTGPRPPRVSPQAPPRVDEPAPEPPPTVAPPPGE